MARAQQLWTAGEEAALLMRCTLGRERCCIEHAKLHRRTVRSVRIKLCRLEKDPANRAPVFPAPVTDRAHARDTDAAAPRVPTARGPEDTSDKRN
jgi:hypothetical protein